MITYWTISTRWRQIPSEQMGHDYTHSQLLACPLVCQPVHVKKKKKTHRPECQSYGEVRKGTCSQSSQASSISDKTSSLVFVLISETTNFFILTLQTYGLQVTRNCIAQGCTQKGNYSVFYHHLQD